MTPKSRSSLRSRRVKLAAVAAASVTAVCSLVDIAIERNGAGATSTEAAASIQALPFDLPSTSALRSSAKLVFAHYYTPIPISLDNAPAATDYYARNYESPNGLDGTTKAYGGIARDRPIPRDRRTESNWRQLDLETEVRQAMSVGLDGFTLDVLQIPGDRDVQVWNTAVTMMAAAHAVDPGFKIALHLDMTGGMRNKTADQLASATATLGNSPSAYRLADGRLVVVAGMAEVHDADWWQSWKNLMATKYKTGVAFVPEFVASEKPYVASFAPISHAMSIWGSRNPLWNNPLLTSVTSPIGRIATAHSLGTKWMQPVSVQDERPRSGIYDEAENTTNLRNSWKVAINGNADWVQIPTWNDYTEGTQIAPSREHGWSFLDISAYYSTWFKTGSAPAITRDTVYVTHRTHLSSATPSFPQTKMMKLRGGSPTRDTVEALTFLRSPATVSITVGSHSYTCQAAAGVDTCTVPLSAGTVSAKVVRNNSTVTSVTSPNAVTTTPYVQDLQYVAASSRREGTSAPASTSVSRPPVAPAPTQTPTPRAPTPTPTPLTPTPLTPALPTPSPTTTPTEPPAGSEPPTPSDPADVDPPISPDVPGPTPIPTDLVVTVPTLSDTYANEGAPDVNYGNQTTEVSRGSIGSIIYLKFAIPTAPEGKTLAKAALRLNTAVDSFAGSNETQQVKWAPSTWAQMTLTWKNKPELSDILLGTIRAGIVPNSVFNTQLTPAMVAPLAGTTASLTISNEGTDSLWVWSQDARNVKKRPVLVLTYS